jgi:hypothetical protein
MELQNTIGLVGNTNKTHRTQPFTENLLLSPEDRSLAVASQIKEQLPSYYIEIWYRFCELGWAYDYGELCIMQSYLLKRILRLHGFPATLKQVVCQYENPTKGWLRIVGARDLNQTTSGIDTHVVVESAGYILDFANRHVNNVFGPLSPMAFIVENKNNVWQDLGFFGKVKYVGREQHAETKNQLYHCRNDSISLIQAYFYRYRI